MIDIDFTAYSKKRVIINNISFDIPFLELNQGEGPTIVITAGMDGDEYDGIVAATRLGITYKNTRNWIGRIIIFPLVNVPGFYSGTSWNPVDQKYPKHIFPGDSNGTATEQLIHQIFSLITGHVDIWLDLHGGNRQEILQPFVWGFPCKDKTVRKKVERILSRITSSTIVYSPWKKAGNVQQQHTVYLVLEAGHSGIVDEQMIQQHMSWVHQIITSQTQSNTIAVKDSLYYYQSHEYGYWKPSFILQTNAIQKNTVLGVVTLGTTEETLYVNKEGICLWYHQSGWVNTQDVLAVIAERSSVIRI